VPDDPGFATFQQGYLEGSNVDPIKEITDLISAQRAYEMNSKIIQAADEMASDRFQEPQVAKGQGGHDVSPFIAVKACCIASSGAVGGCAVLHPNAQAGMGTAVVPERTIYPGEELGADTGPRGVVTNPNLRGGYVAVTSEMLGKVTTRTLLPGRTIPVGALRDAWAVERGATVPWCSTATA
jgi:flagella basal body P-ring formation protein FlgA